MQTDDLNKLEKGELVNKVVEKLISEFGPGISEGEEIVAVQVKAIVKGEDHIGIKGFQKGMFEVLEAKMHFEKLASKYVEKAAEANPEIAHLLSTVDGSDGE